MEEWQKLNAEQSRIPCYERWICERIWRRTAAALATKRPLETRTQEICWKQQQHTKKTDCTQQAEAERVGHLGHPPARRSLAQRLLWINARCRISAAALSAISCAWRKIFLLDRSEQCIRSRQEFCSRGWNLHLCKIHLCEPSGAQTAARTRTIVRVAGVTDRLASLWHFIMTCNELWHITAFHTIACGMQTAS
jgi:hypothetical protein